MSKIDNALVLIKTALSKAKNPVVAFSGGKDSTVVLHLVRQIAPNTIAQFCNTEVESPQTVEFTRTIPNLIELHPDKKHTFWKLEKKYGLPKPKGGKKKR